MSVFCPIPKKGNTKEFSNYCKVALVRSNTKVKLKFLQARLQQYVNCELPDVHAGFRKGRGSRDQIASICWIIKKAREFQKTSISDLLTMPKPLTMWIIKTVENSSRDGNTRLPYLPPKITICRSRSNSQKWTWNNRLVPNWDRITSKLYIVTLLI